MGDSAGAEPPAADDDFDIAVEDLARLSSSLRGQGEAGQTTG
jgi:hypothetical protein